MGLQDSESTTSSAEPPMAPAATGAKNAKGGKSQFNEYSARSFGITMCPGCGKHFGSEEAVNKHATGKGKSKKKSCAQALRQLREALAKDGSPSATMTPRTKASAAGARPKERETQRAKVAAGAGKTIRCPGCSKGFASEVRSDWIACVSSG